MITIKTIIALCKDKQLKNCVFMCDEPGKVAVVVNGESMPYFEYREEYISILGADGQTLVNPTTIDMIDSGNNYFYYGPRYWGG